jgi:hypothetical protein
MVLQNLDSKKKPYMNCSLMDILDFKWFSGRKHEIYKFTGHISFAQSINII